MKGEGKMSDMIDRDATIGALRYECEKLSEFMDKCLATGEYGLRAGAKTERKRIGEDIYILENMPPAQLERRTCRNCKYGGAYVGRRVICDHEYGLVDCGPESFCSLWSKKDEA